MTRFLFLVLPLIFLFGCSNDDALKQFYTSVHLNEGNYFYNNGNYDRAIERYSRAIRLDPEGEFSFGSYYFRAFSYYNKGSYGSAIKDFTMVIALSPKFEDAYIARGNCYALKKLYREAIADFQDVIRMNPDNAYAYFNLGNVYGNMDLSDQAINYYGKGIAVSLEFFGPAYLRRGEMYNKIGSYGKAIADLTRVIDNDSNNRDAYVAREKAYRNKGMTARAKMDGERVRVLGLELAKDYQDAANLMLANGNIEGAIRYYTRSIDLDPLGRDRDGNAGETYIYLGQLYFNSENYTEAIRDFNKALSVNPKSWLAMSDLGTCYAKLGRLDQAESFYLKSLRFNPSNDLSFFNLGKLYAEKKQPARSARYYSQFIKINPQHPTAYLLRADQYYKSGVYEQAVEDCDKAEAMGERNSLVLLMRANANSALGKKGAALLDYDTYIRKDKNPFAGYLGRADIFIRDGEFDKAREDYRSALGLITNFADNASMSEYISNQIALCEKKIREKK